MLSQKHAQYRELQAAWSIQCSLCREERLLPLDSILRKCPGSEQDRVNFTAARRGMARTWR